MCFNCFRFGHLKNQCRSKTLCKRCGNSAHEEAEHCPNKDRQPVCVNCRQNHLPRDKSCPEWALQVKVRTLAASGNLSLDDAYAQVVRADPPSHPSRSYSNFKKRSPPPPPAISPDFSLSLPPSPTSLASTPLPSYSHVVKNSTNIRNHSPHPSSLVNLNPQNSAQSRSSLSNRLNLSLPPLSKRSHPNVPPTVSSSQPSPLHRPNFPKHSSTFPPPISPPSPTPSQPFPCTPLSKSLNPPPSSTSAASYHSAPLPPHSQPHDSNYVHSFNFLLDLIVNTIVPLLFSNGLTGDASSILYAIKSLPLHLHNGQQ